MSVDEPDPRATATPGQIGPAAAEPLLAARGVSLRLGSGDRSVQALDDITLEVRAGRRVGVVGESGSGKSTLLRVLDGLRQPDTGEVTFAGKSILGRRADLTALRSQVSMVFQDPRSCLDPRMSVGRIITEPLRSPVLRSPVLGSGVLRSGVLGSRGRRSSAGRHGIDVPARLEQVMTEVGLDPADRDRYPHEFSGGQRQRIAIARALVTEPSVLLADEPVSALDVSVRAQVLNLLVRLVRDRGLTMVLVSHDLSVVRHLCDEVAVIQSGRIVEQGDLAKVYADPQHPLTQRLLASVPTLRTGAS